MGRDTWRYRAHEREREKKKRMNPVWRGVGCFIVVLLALGGYFFSGWFLNANKANAWVYLPPEVIRPPFAPWLPEGLILKVVVAFLFMIMSYGVFTTIYAVAFPIEPGETDSPPLKRTRRRGR